VKYLTYEKFSYIIKKRIDKTGKKKGKTETAGGIESIIKKRGIDNRKKVWYTKRKGEDGR
jgi:hypothetical protein